MIPSDLKDLKKMLGVKLKLVLNTGSSMKQGKVMRSDKKLSDDYQKSAAICMLHPSNLNKLGIKENDNVKLKTSEGSIVLKAVASKSCPEDSVFVPKGPWVNLVIGTKTQQTGSPPYKGMEVEVEATSDKIPSIGEILQKYRSKNETKG